MASSYLAKTFTETNRKTFTFSAWIKRSKISSSSNNVVFSTYTSADFYTTLYFRTGDDLQLYNRNASTGDAYKAPAMKFRDTNGWYHVVVAVDTTQSTADDRIKFYVNGELQTVFAENSAPAQNYIFRLNGATEHQLGAINGGSYFDGLMTHIHFIDGTQYAASDFGETDSTTGIWKPKTSPSVTYGTNGFFLDMADSSNMGNDVSGNNNDLTVSGTITQTIDTPSNVFAVWNAVAYENAFAGGNGNTTAPGGSSANHNMFVSTLAVSKGKYYFEAEIDAYGGSNPSIGIASYDVNLTFGNYVGGITGTIGYTGNGNINENGSSLVTGLNSYTSGDIIGVGLDLDNNKIYFYKNGTLENTGGTTITNRLYGFAVSQYGNTGHWLANFGNGYFGTTAISSEGTNASGLGKFEYDVPTGYTALCTKGLNE